MISDNTKLGAVTTTEWARETLAEGDPLLARLPAIGADDYLLARRLKTRAKRDPFEESARRGGELTTGTDHRRRPGHHRTAEGLTARQLRCHVMQPDCSFANFEFRIGHHSREINGPATIILSKAGTFH
jgi:hypothetical protein